MSYFFYQINYNTGLFFIQSTEFLIDKQNRMDDSPVKYNKTLSNQKTVCQKSSVKQNAAKKTTISKKKALRRLKQTIKKQAYLKVTVKKENKVPVYLRTALS